MVSSVWACQASIPLNANRMWRANWMHAGQNYENGNPSPSRLSPLQFQKRRQLFIGVHNETLSVVGDARQQRNLSTSLPRFQEMLFTHRNSTL